MARARERTAATVTSQCFRSVRNANLRSWKNVDMPPPELDGGFLLSFANDGRKGERG
jgi:hypothetical protein